MGIIILIAAILALYWQFILLAISLLATAIHGGQELVGWWGKRGWILFLIAQASFVALAVIGILTPHHWIIWVLIVLRLTDGIGFHTVFHPEWPGRETRLLPLADAGLLFLWMIS